MKVLIVGLGSIAKKHIHALRVVCNDVQIYALRSNKSASEENGIINVFNWEQIPSGLDFIIISNPTSEHYNTILDAVGLNIPLFIEKPPVLSLDEIEKIEHNDVVLNLKTYVAFNFRFHPVIKWLKENLIGKTIVEIQSYCGSYLPDWRPGTDYRTNYSARKELGGGVHLDLIHELDFITWMCGIPEESITVNAKKSDLEINSSDFGFYLLEYENFIATITLNYYRKFSSRRIELVLKDAVWYVDLLKCKVTDQEDNILFEQAFNVMDSYVDQMDYFIDCLKKDIMPMNNLKDALQTMKICLK